MTDIIMEYLIRDGGFVQSQKSSEEILAAVEELRNAGFMTLIYDGPEVRVWRIQ